MVNDMKGNPDNMLGVKIEIYPDEEQKKQIHDALNCYRYVYNKVLATQICSYFRMTEEEYFSYRAEGLSHKDIYFKFKDEPKGKFISFIDMCKIIRDLRNNTPWLKEGICISAARCAAKSVYGGYRKFFKNPRHFHHPKFKKKAKNEKQTYAFRGERLYFKPNNYVKIEGISTWIKHDNVPIPKCKKYQYYDATITYDGYSRYYLSFKVEIFYPITFYPLMDAVGVDIGMRKFAVLSDGTVYPKLDTKRLEMRRRKKESKVAKDRQRRLKQSREAKTKLEQIPMSKRQQKRYLEYRKLTTHIWNKRKTYVHQVTTNIIKKRPSAIVIEDLAVQTMVEHPLYKGLDVKEFLFGEFKRQMEYKAKWNKIPLIKAPKSYPSTQLCSRCGARKRIGKSEIYECDVCGLVIDRDLNAALNLKSLATLS